MLPIPRIHGVLAIIWQLSGNFFPGLHALSHNRSSHSGRGLKPRGKRVCLLVRGSDVYQVREAVGERAMDQSVSAMVTGAGRSRRCLSYGSRSRSSRSRRGARFAIYGRRKASGTRVSTRSSGSTRGWRGNTMSLPRSIGCFMEVIRWGDEYPKKVPGAATIIAVSRMTTAKFPPVYGQPAEG